jgi:hypothetical protein
VSASERDAKRSRRQPHISLFLALPALTPDVNKVEVNSNCGLAPERLFTFIWRICRACFPIFLVWWGMSQIAGGGVFTHKYSVPLKVFFIIMEPSLSNQ